MAIKIISAGAGSGKTYRLMQEMVLLIEQGVRPQAIMATTFTKKAAQELRERVYTELLDKHLYQEAQDIQSAWIGSVHSIGLQILQRFAFEAGIAPGAEALPEHEVKALFDQALSAVIRPQEWDIMQELTSRLDLNDEKKKDWLDTTRDIINHCRINNISPEQIQAIEGAPGPMVKQTLSRLMTFLREETLSAQDFNKALKEALLHAQSALAGNEADTTKDTDRAKSSIKYALRSLTNTNQLPKWSDWAKLSKLKTGAKSKELVTDLRDLTAQSDRHPDMHKDFVQYSTIIFDIAARTMDEYNFQKARLGLLDYVDMEVKVNELLDLPAIQSWVKQEIQLLMVDEFQDTNPIQLSIFWKISQLTAQSVWVGDPKQSIYGFRGAESQLMESIINHLGGVAPENILPNSWRSRADIVYFTNYLFSKAFQPLDVARIALNPQRTKAKDPDGMSCGNEVWYLQYTGEKKRLNVTWRQNALCASIVTWMQSPPIILDKNTNKPRPARFGDIAILCRTNPQVKAYTECMGAFGVSVAISRKGLFLTPEGGLLLAIVKYFNRKDDNLSIAEILKYGANQPINQILEDRWAYLQSEPENHWAATNEWIENIDLIRQEAFHLSAFEIVEVLVERLQLKNHVSQWSNSTQRLKNIDQFRQLCLTYERQAQQAHKPSTLSGFIQSAAEMERNSEDWQAANEDLHAINICTYHKSKGLEWPIVILSALDSSLRIDPLGVKTESPSESIDLSNILAHRKVRYWFQPYGKQQKATHFQEALDHSEVFTETEIAAREEEKRLLYVGITRARDYLILPVLDKGSPWLDRVYHGNEQLHVLPEQVDGEQEYLADWNTWNDVSIPLQLRAYPFDDMFDDIAVASDTQSQPQRLVPLKSGVGNFEPYYWDPYTELPADTKPWTKQEARNFAPVITTVDPATQSLIEQALNSLLPVLLRYGMDYWNTVWPSYNMLPQLAHFETQLYDYLTAAVDVCQPYFVDCSDPLSFIYVEKDGRYFQEDPDLQCKTAILTHPKSYFPQQLAERMYGHYFWWLGYAGRQNYNVLPKVGILHWSSQGELWIYNKSSDSV